MFSRTLFLILVAVTCCLGFVMSTNHAEEASPSEDKLNQLLIERRDTIKALREAIKVLYQNGQTEYTTLMDVENKLLDAELELANTSAQRLALREAIVENMKRAEELLQQRFLIGNALNTDVLSAKAERLNAEIALQRERSIHR